METYPSEVAEFQKEIFRKSRIIIEDLEGKAINRELVARLLWLTTLSQSNIFLIGEPGTAKTYLAEKIHYAVSDSKYLEHLMTFDTKPEELFGVPVVQPNGDVIYNIKNSVVDSNIIFIDEIYKGNSVILNSFLGVLHQNRIFHMRGETRGPVKTEVMVGISASNEFEQSSSLGALADRFHFRLEVNRIMGDLNYRNYIYGNFDKSNNFRETVLVNEIKFIKEYALRYVVMPEYIAEIIILLKDDFVQKKLKSSDRKIGYSVTDIMKVSAFCNNRLEVDVSDLFVFMHTLWENFEERDELKTILVRTFFKTKDTYEEYIEESRKIFEGIFSSFDVEGNNILYKRVDISPVSIQNNFPLWYEQISKFKKSFSKTSTRFRKMLNKIEQMIMIEDNIGRNIFNIHPLNEESVYIPKPYKRTFDEEMIKTCENYIVACEDNIKICNKFLNECKTPYDYSEFSIV